MSVLRSVFAGVLLAGVAFSLAACTPRPRPPHVDEPESRAGRPFGLGGFNLQKRHGLGGWDQKPGVSERQLLRELSERGNSVEEAR